MRPHTFMKRLLVGATLSATMAPFWAVADPQLDNPKSAAIERYLRVSRELWPDDGGRKTGNFNDLYTNVNVITDKTFQHSDDYRDYKAETTPGIVRLFINKTMSITTVANAQVRSPDLNVSLPIFSMTHSSVRGTGETFVTNLASSHVQAPLFRVGPSTTLTIHFNTSAAKQQTSDMLSLIISAVQKAVGIAAPTSNILTTLSQPEISKTAQALDSAWSGLFNSSLTEDLEIGRVFSNWSPTSKIEVVGIAPKGYLRISVNQQTPAASDYMIGRWFITLTCPRLSVFFPRDVCSYNENWIGKDGWNTDTSQASLDIIIKGEKKEIDRYVSPSQILQTNLSSQVTIQSYVQSQTWYTDYIQTSVSAPKGDASKKGGSDPAAAASGKTDEQAARKFCAQALTALYGQGLSQYDSALVLRAISRAMPGIATQDRAAAIEQYCPNLVSDLDVSWSTTSSAPAPSGGSATPKAQD